MSASRGGSTFQAVLFLLSFFVLSFQGYGNDEVALEKIRHDPNWHEDERICVNTEKSFLSSLLAPFLRSPIQIFSCLSSHMEAALFPNKPVSVV